MSKFKVGETVVATTNKYLYTTKRNKWVGRVTAVNGTRFSAETVSVNANEATGSPLDELRKFISQVDPVISGAFENLDESDFEVLGKPERKTKYLIVYRSDDSAFVREEDSLDSANTAIHAIADMVDVDRDSIVLYKVEGKFPITVHHMVSGVPESRVPKLKHAEKNRIGKKIHSKKDEGKVV